MKKTFTAKELYRQLHKGAKYFNEKFAQGNRTPVVMRQVAEFEKEVIDPLDRACAKMSAEERRSLENEYFPF